ncbi:hypothetical protein [Paraglaciecola sp.]|uniref:hypothetical protein n=1 Tax=Paraglaciecola sp. TaxID=1920173 RepID=UPI0030F3E78A
MKLTILILMAGGLLGACSPLVVTTEPLATKTIYSVYGHWITEPDGSVMLDPQPSGLVKWRDKLVTLSDRSAIELQRLRLRTIDPATAALIDGGMKMELSPAVKQSCFGSYVGNNPDLESLVVDPADDSVFYMITEDATYADAMTQSCQQKYQDTGSSAYPNLLVRLQVNNDQKVSMTHIRPLQYDHEFAVGDSPNDGIEALAFGPNRILYLGLERDSHKQARVFTLNMTDDFWQSDEFAPVTDAKLNLPKFDKGNHPINGMDYYETKDGNGYLIASARNDSALWIIDIKGQKETRILAMEFYAQLTSSTDNCQDYEKMANASIEGVAVIEQTVWMVNDPWKEVYPKNILCLQNKSNYENYSPLLFSLPIQTSWFE